MKNLMENGGDLTQASSNLGHGAGVRLPFKYLGIELTGDNADPNAALTLFTYESIGQKPPTAPPDPGLLLSGSEPKRCITGLSQAARRPPTARPRS